MITRTRQDNKDLEVIKSHPGDHLSTPGDPRFAEFRGEGIEQNIIYSHAAIMLFSWIILVPFGVLIVWTQKMHNDVSWYFYHRIFSH